MAKSQGNFLTVQDVLDKGYSGAELRYAMLKVQYRQSLNFTWAGLDDARASIRRVRQAWDRVARIAAGAARAGAAALATEDVAEDVAEGLGEPTKTLRSRPTGAEASGVGVDPSVPVLVVGSALLRVGEHLVGFFRLLELLFGFLVAVTLVAVRVVLHGQLAVGLLDVVLGGIFCHTEHVVIVTLCHVLLLLLSTRNPPCAGQRTGESSQGACARWRAELLRLLLVLDFLELGVDHVVIGGLG
jgi:hypothetical protein